MNKLLMKSALCLVAAFAVLAAPSAFADHGWHRGYHHDRGWRGHGRVVRYYGDHDRYRYYHRDHFGRWIAGAVVLGALTNLVIDATQPNVVYYDVPPPAYPPATRVIYRTAPITRTYYSNSDPYQTRYIGHDDSRDDH